MGSMHARSRTFAIAGLVALVALPLTPAMSAWAASSRVSQGVTPAAASAPAKKDCERDKDNDFDNNRETDTGANDDRDDRDDRGDKDCPPPVVPEAPLAVLLPLSAGVMIGGTYVVARLRSRSKQSA